MYLFIGELIGLYVYTAILKFAFDLTWYQGFALGYLFWLLHDACKNPNK